MRARASLIPCVAIACLGMAGPVAAQTATDVQCTGCVDAEDIAASAVTTGKIQNGAVNNNKLGAQSVGTAKIQDGAVTADKLGNGSVGTSALQNGAVTTDKIKNGSVGLKKVSNTVKDHVTLLEYNAQATAIAAGSTFQKLAEFGTFEKLFNSSTVELKWQDHARWADDDGDNIGFCDFQLRVDDVPMASALDPEGTGRVVLYDSGGGVNDAQFAISVFFTSLPPGIRTVSVWVRSLDDSCAINLGNFPRYVLIRERNEVIEMPNPM